MQVTTAPTLDSGTVGAIQRRIVLILAIAQVFGGVGVATGAAVGALLAADLSSDSFSGLASAASVTGAALIAIPVSRLMDQHGRRPGLMLAYAIGICGAFTTVIGASLGWFPLALLGLIGIGGGTTATLQSRYAATDLATPERRGRALSTVVWATTLGSVLGPNLASPMGRFAGHVGVPALAGPYLLTMCALLVSGVIIATFLRPDPLHVARDVRHIKEGHSAMAPVERSMRTALETIAASPGARNGLAAIVLGHAVMVAVMSMTPLHLRHADEGLRVIGIVISLHIAGMYAFSPLVGIAVDRIGRRPVITLGSLILLSAFLIAGTASGHQAPQLSIGLCLLGLGWSCTMISGSTLLTDSVPIEQLPNVQGTADVMMGFGGASAGLLAGLVVGIGSYAILAMVAACVILPLLFVTLLQPRVATVQSPA
ncbi:MAG TPA: MFS transporter [Thermomicrobiales bacterium]|nr:MFS transporter [Thermomicrobiales bacterium]